MKVRSLMLRLYLYITKEVMMVRFDEEGMVALMRVLVDSKSVIRAVEENEGKDE
jgi:hypothetical protein